MAYQTIPVDGHRVNAGSCRARCPKCFSRFPWPVGEPWTALEPLVRPAAACPTCHRMVPLVEEPLDERWWTWSQSVTPKETVY